MKRNRKFNCLFFIAVLSIVLSGCQGRASTENEEIPDHSADGPSDIWRIDLEHVESGCNGPDCIRSIDAPKFISIEKTDFLHDDDLVIGIKSGNTIKCYPHAILNWHEIINDDVNGKEIAIIYCPLTGSGMAWNRRLNGKISNFGVSGLLFNSNIIPYDRVTKSAWSQMKQLCVNGELLDTLPVQNTVMETSWATWKKLFPSSEVLSTETGMQRDYFSYPYDDYRSSDDIYFDVEYSSDSLPAKERLFGITNGNHAAVYRFDDFKNGVTVIDDTLFNVRIAVIGSKRDNFIIAFENNDNRKFTSLQNKLPALFTDENGNYYDAFGYCTEGSEKGKQLKSLNGFIAYWFAWYAFYPELQLR